MILRIEFDQAGNLVKKLVRKASYLQMLIQITDTFVCCISARFLQYSKGLLKKKFANSPASKKDSAWSHLLFHSRLLRFGECSSSLDLCYGKNVDIELNFFFRWKNLDSEWNFISKNENFSLKTIGRGSMGIKANFD